MPTRRLISHVSTFSLTRLLNTNVEGIYKTVCSANSLGDLDTQAQQPLGSTTDAVNCTIVDSRTLNDSRDKEKVKSAGAGRTMIDLYGLIVVAWVGMFVAF